MKASYIAILNSIELKGVNKDEYDIANSQFVVLSEAANVFANEIRDRPVTRVFGQVDIKLYADLGTFWNMLPPPDIDSASLDHRIEGDYNSDKNFNHEFQERMLSYSRRVISAHLLVNIGKTSVVPVFGVEEGGGQTRPGQRLGNQLHCFHDIIITDTNGKSDVVTLRNSAKNILRTFYETPKSSDHELEKQRIIAAAANNSCSC